MAYSPLNSFAGTSISGTTSTGAGTAIAGLASQFAAQVVVNGTGTGTFTIEGSLDGSNFVTIIPATTYANSRLIRSSTYGLVAYTRARITAHGSTNTVSIAIAGQ